MTDRDGWKLRGPVRSCRLQRTWYARRCGADACESDERNDVTNLEFRADGSLDRRSHHNPDGSEWTAIHEYDATSRLVWTRTEATTGPIEVKHYEYDAAGRLSRVLIGESGRDRVSESYDYDATGRKKKTIHVDVAAQRPNTTYSWGVESSDAFYSAPGAAAVTTVYNVLDQPIELTFHDAAGQPLNRVEFVYDEAGHLVEEAQTRVADIFPPEIVTRMNPAQLATMRALVGGGSETSRILHQYDARGRRIETRSSMWSLGQNRKTMAYNDHGDQIEEISEHDDREYNIDDEGRVSESPGNPAASRSEARFKYDYDAQGNWIEKVVEGRGGTAPEYSVSSIERRTLTYYDDPSDL